MRLKPRPWALMLYGLGVTLVAIAGGSWQTLATTFILAGMPGLVLGLVRLRFLVLLVPLTVVGTFLNLMMLYYAGLAKDPGGIVASIGPIDVPKFVVETTGIIALRVFSFSGAGLLVATLVTPRDALKSLVDELGIPKGIAFSLSFALRLLPLVRKDLGEIMAVRKQRGYRTVPITPSDYSTIISPLLSVTLERALWVGISSELRGFRTRPQSRARPSFAIPEAVLAMLLAVQVYVLLVYG